MPLHRNPGRVTLVALAIGSLLLPGCFNPFDPRVASKHGVSEPAPVPNTPRGILDLFAWCWNHRAYEEYQEVFTDDFTFQFANADSAGNTYRDRALYRQDELDTARHLFIEGTANEPPATRIDLVFSDRTFFPEPDSRLGKAYPWHQEIKRNVVLSIDTDQQQFRITGAARFFLTRGDSAQIPGELRQRGFAPDPNRWWIERWEDETIDTPGGSLLAQLDPGTLAAVRAAFREGRVHVSVAEPARTTGGYFLDVTWGRLKSFYH